MKRLRGLTYCTHFIGVGHLKRILILCEKLLEFCDIDFIDGGNDMGLTIDHPGFRHIYLPSSSFEELRETKIDKLLNSRQKVLEQKCDFSRAYDFVITEQFPFTKLLFYDEAVKIIETVKSKNPKAIIGCSYKGYAGIPVEKIPLDKREDWMKAEHLIIKIIKRYFDVVFVHTDPKMINLDDTFFVVGRALDNVVYTGFLTKSFDMSTVPKREKQILVITGSGNQGAKLYFRVLDIADQVQEYRFVFVLGPTFSRENKYRLEQEIIKRQITNVHLVPFIRDFEETLLKSALAITLGGSTLFTLASTKTPGIVFPSDIASDQQFVAKKFADKGVVRVASKKDLEPERLLPLIKEGLMSPYRDESSSIDLDGVDKTVNILKKMLRGQ